LDSRKVLIVLNKADLPTQLLLPEWIRTDHIAVSALSGTGVDLLLNHLRKHCSADTEHVASGLIRLRHFEGLTRTQALLENAYTKVLQLPPAMECVAADLHAGYGEICTLLGVSVGDEVLDLIFSEFCIGK
jgi:tRNA modification GTPase